MTRHEWLVMAPYRPADPRHRQVLDETGLELHPADLVLERCATCNSPARRDAARREHRGPLAHRGCSESGGEMVPGADGRGLPGEDSLSLTGTVADIPDASLLERAVLGARWVRKAPRWVVVSEVLGLGSTYSFQLCQRFGLDPNEQVRPWPRRTA